MTQTRSRVWIEIIGVIVMLALAAVVMYALVPFVTKPDQQVVPPPHSMDTGQTILTLFIAATAIGAPLTAGIVLALVFKVVSKRVPASSSVAPAIPTPAAKPRAAESAAEMAPREARVWKIVATIMLLLISAGALAALAAAFTQFYMG
jgi:hypothetical protein